MYLGLYQVVYARHETELSANHKAKRIDVPSTNKIMQLAKLLKGEFSQAGHPQTPC